jgi:hypothetical protein
MPWSQRRMIELIDPGVAAEFDVEDRSQLTAEGRAKREGVVVDVAVIVGRDSADEWRRIPLVPVGCGRQSRRGQDA